MCRYLAGRLQCRSELMVKGLGAICVEVSIQLDNIIRGRDNWTRVMGQTKIRNWVSELKDLTKYSILIFEKIKMTTVREISKEKTSV